MWSPDNKQKDTDHSLSTRLKRKLKLQEMRCNLMSTKMTELKTALSTKKRQLRMSVRRVKEEEKKMKDMEKEFHKRMTALLAGDSSQVKEQPSKSSTNRVSTPMVGGSSSGSNSKKIETVASSSSSSSSSSTPSSSKELRINEGASCSGVNTSTISSACTDTIAITTKNSNNVIQPNGADHGHLLGTSKLEDLFENELMCPICHELYIKPVALSCSHIFCSFCIEQWHRKAHRCPICRNMILDRAPQNVLENVIDKVVSTMDEDSKKRRADVIKDRPTPSEYNRFSRNDGHRDRLLSTLQGNWRNFTDYSGQSDSYSDSDSYMPSFSSPLPAYGAFVDGSDSELDSSDIDHEQMFGPWLGRDPYARIMDAEYFQDQDTPTEEEEDDDGGSVNNDGDDTEDDDYLSEDSALYDNIAVARGDNYDFDQYSSTDSYSWAENYQGSRQSPISIDSGSDSDSSSVFITSSYNGRDLYDREEEDEEEEEDDDDDEEEDEDEDNEEEDNEIDEENEEEDDDIVEVDDDDDDEEEEEDDDEENEEDADDVDEDYFDGVVDPDSDESRGSSPWESMEMTESDSDL